MTTLDRLYKKRLLERHRAGRSFLYSPRLCSQTEDGGSAVPLPGRRSMAPEGALISYLLNVAGAYDEALLKDLEKAIAARRQQLEQTEKIEQTEEAR